MKNSVGCKKKKKFYSFIQYTDQIIFVFLCLSDETRLLLFSKNEPFNCLINGKLPIFRQSSLKIGLKQGCGNPIVDSG